MKTKKLNQYEQQAVDFAKKHNVKLTVLGHEYDYYFDDDKQPRDVFKLKLTRNGKSYSFKFGQSIMNAGKEPTMYDVLSCLTKYDPETFEDFCGNFGYDIDSRKAEKVYKSVVREFECVKRLFGDILEELQEIQ